MQENGLVPAATLSKIISLDDLLRQGKTEMSEAESKGNETVRAFVQAKMLAKLREQMAGELMTDVMSLMGTPLGFITDKDRETPSKRYTVDQVKDAVIEALICGFRLVGNEFNIISGRFYPAKNGVKRLLLEIDGLTDLKLKVGVPRPSEAGKSWMVPAKASWKLNGKDDEIDRTGADWKIVLPLHGTDKPATVAGKAESRLLRLVLQRVTGSTITVEDDEMDDQTIEGTVEAAEPPESPSDPDVSEEFVDSSLQQLDRKTAVVERGNELSQMTDDEEMRNYIFGAVERRCEELSGQPQPA